MLLGRFYTFLCKLFYISRPRLPPWAVYFILMPWASALGFSPGLQSWASALGFSPGLQSWASVLGFGPGLQSWASALGFSPGLRPWALAQGAFAFQSGPYARGVRVLHIFTHLRARGSGFFRFYALARGGFQVFSSFAPLCGPLRGDFRAFPAGVILSPRFACESGLPRPLRGYASAVKDMPRLSRYIV